MVGKLSDQSVASQTYWHVYQESLLVLLGDRACFSESVLVGYSLPGWIIN